MVLIILGAMYFIFILRLVFYCGLTVEAIYNTTYFRMKKEYYWYLFTELELSTLIYSLPVKFLYNIPNGEATAGKQAEVPYNLRLITE
jgi:hypothetical protein